MLWCETEFGLKRSILPQFMTCQIELSRGDDRQDAVHRMVESLVGGGLARLRTECGDYLLALATHSEASNRFAALRTNQNGALMVSGALAVADFVPDLPRGVARLFDRTVGPLHIWFTDGVDDRIVQQLPPQVAQLAGSPGEIRFAIPQSDVIQAVLRLLPGPLVVMTVEGELGHEQLEVDVRVTSSGRTSKAAVIRFQGDTWSLDEPAGLSEEDITRMMAERIVFVCTGNTCRSPMAEGVFRKLLAERLGCTPDSLIEHGFDVGSAGVAAMNGAPASQESVEVCAQHGVDLRSHASQSLQLPLIESSDRLYTMTAGHRDAILYQYPAYAERVHLLSRSGRDVTDPIGSGWSAYVRCFDEISENLQILVDELTAPT